MEQIHMFGSWITAALLVFTINATGASVSTLAVNMIQCGNLTCSNNSKCRDDRHGGYGCLCQTGYTGTTCGDDFDECSRGYPCMHRGRCHNTIGSYRCECFEGWFGDIHCHILDSSTTVHKCMPGWIGEWCQDQCLNDSMCRPTEVCKKRGRGLRCLCAPGWHGVNCTIDIDECMNNPCPNTATCMNSQGSHNCLCLPGWKGDKCDEDIDECLINPCQHSSTCTDEQGYYNCTCALGWKGDNCEEDINECDKKPCNVTLTCENSPGSFTCSGKQMDYKEKPNTRKTKEIIFAVLGSVLTVCSILTCLGIMKYKWNIIRGIWKGKGVSQQISVSVSQQP